MSQEEPKQVEATADQQFDMKDAAPASASASASASEQKEEEAKVEYSEQEVAKEDKVEETKTEDKEKPKEQGIVTAPPPVTEQETKEPEVKFTGDVAIQPPALRRLNGDSSWLLSLPLIDEESKYSSFNLLIDPWFSPSQQVDFHPLFSAQTRIESAEFGNIGQLEEFLAKEAKTGTEGRSSPSPQVDGILISHPFTDHMHKETLLDPSVRLEIPFYGTKDSVPLLRQLFDSKTARAAMAEEDAPTASSRHIHIIPTAQKNHLSWEAEPNQPTPLPSGFKIMHLPSREPWHYSVSKGPAWHKLHGGIAMLWETSKTETGELIGNGGQKEYKREFDSLLYSAHGIIPNSIPSWLCQSGRKTLVHGLDEQNLPKLMGGAISLGLPNIVNLASTKNFPAPFYRPNVLVATHDERKASKGVVSSALKRVEWNQEQAVEKLKLPKLKEGEVEKYEVVKIMDPKVGEAISLA